ncbi:response regulator [Metabacillus malikii]|uniref:Two-component system response regulator YesN n=1 Tax=Metabacillus malikii TaxID=1504265 RepID=A0ABT9ZFT6_9BACI|nr:response regulator [Metabacillus malikii]MDQ0230749.1 two-component system response regulator YesN [Metabacillus malikii]
MISVMIVDDESTTRQGIVTLIPWEDYGFSVIGTAGSGFEAIEKVEQLKPKLMIVDIKMPGMSGIELIEHINKSNSSMKFLILSGHAEFEYAKRAMKCNVNGYLLKPVDEDELISHLIEIKTEIDKQDYYHEMKTKMVVEKKERLIMSGIKGENLSRLDEFLKQESGWYSYRTLIIETNGDDNHKSQLKTKLINEIESKQIGFVVIYDTYLCVLLHGNHALVNHESHLYHQLNKICRSQATSFRAAISNKFEDIKKLPIMYESARTLLEYQFFYKEDCLLSNQSVPIYISKARRTEGVNVSSSIEKLQLVIEIGDKASMNRLLLEFMQQLVDNGETEEKIKHHFVQLTTSLLNKLMYEHQNIHPIILNVLSRVFEIEEKTNIQSLLTYVETLFDEITSHMEVNDSTLLVKKMIHLIENNFDKNIKLETLAEVLNYNRSYLGKVFKNSTGVHFNTYLDKVRIENAKKLLLKGLKVYQVAERTGFSNVDYFHSKFRKYVGLSPSKYRNEQRVKQ